MAIQRQFHVTNRGKNLNVTKQPCHARTLAITNESWCFDGRPITRARKNILAVKMNE